jgi:hypothetical protein
MSQFRPGDRVVVLPRLEILRTLDRSGRCDGLPFMPEMLPYCGKQFTIYKSAHKSCDYTTAYPYRSRRISDAFLLEGARCDGLAHGGCQAGCTLIWKGAWLRRADVTPLVQVAPSDVVPGEAAETSLLWSHTYITDPTDGLPKYLCQATQIRASGEILAWWDLRQYIKDYTSGNVTLRRLLSGFLYSSYFHLSEAGIGIGSSMRWIFNGFSFALRGTRWPRTPGTVPDGTPTPSTSLNLKPGELVRIKSHDEILNTISKSNRNRGLLWDAELVPYCGGRYRVLRRVTKLISEQTGKMVEMKGACIVLDSVICQARYSSCRMFCPRAMYPYWREIWLERIDDLASSPACKKTSNEA